MQWLQLDRLDRASPDADKYPAYFQNNLGELMTQELMLFADAIMVEDRSILEFIDADWGFSATRWPSTTASRIFRARSGRASTLQTGIASSIPTSAAAAS